VSKGRQWAITQEMAEIAEGILQAPKHVLFWSGMQGGLLATYPARISTIFQTTDVNRCRGAYTAVKTIAFFVLYATICNMHVTIFIRFETDEGHLQHKTEVTKMHRRK